MRVETKLFELRDVATFIPVIASLMESGNEREAWLLRRAGYAPNTGLVLLTRLDGGKSSYDPYDWGGRTYPVAHEYIAANWPFLRSGDLVDVRAILGEIAEPCASEQEIAP